jgi:alpha-mannosidase
MAHPNRQPDDPAMFATDIVTATDSSWSVMLADQQIPAEQADFALRARGEILKTLSDPSAAVIAGFFYRDTDGDGDYEPEERLTAALLGLPQLTGPDAPASPTVYTNCFCFGPLKAGHSYTLTFDVDGIEPFSREITAAAGLNVVHVPVEPTKPLTYVITHSHFDPEWRKTFEGYLADEVPQMVERVKLLRSQPEHCFVLDEELAARALIERHPELRNEIRQRYLEGAIEIKGVVTAGDLTMPLGESIIRQMTDGEQLISRLLGVTIRPTVFWNVDNYGLNFQLPQILTLAGRKYVVLGEYSNSLGQEPMLEELPFSDPAAWDHPEFWLEGIEGSKVLMHRSCYITQPYGPRVPVERLRSHRSSFSFDGWDFAPPTRELPAMLREFNDLETAEQYATAGDSTGRPVLSVPPGESKYILATSEQFFNAVEKADDVPTIRTESRIGFWTGVYESRVRGRQHSRRLECLLLATETLASQAWLAGMDSALDELREAWYLLLINHHHDPQLTIMAPGLFDSVLSRYDDCSRAADAILAKVVDHLTHCIATEGQRGTPVVVFNPLAWPRTSVVSADLPADTDGRVRVVNAAGEAVASQVVCADSGVKTVAFAAGDIPATGWQTYYLQADATDDAESALTASGTALENEHIRVELANGLVEAVIEKTSGKTLFAASKELTDPNGSAAVGEVFIWDDEGCIAQVRPVDFMDSAKLVARSSQVARTTRVVEGGPARVAVETSFKMDWGSFVQRVSLDADGRFVDFRVRVDWQPAPEGGRRVRMAFPSTFTDAKVWRDIPFAVVPWEQSDVIQPINSWLGLADADGTAGAALIHTGQCSQQVRSDCIWQTLLRSIRMPGEIDDNVNDPPCCWDLSGDTALEEGQHTFDFRLHVFAGDWKSAAVPRRSMEFTMPPIARTTDAHQGELFGESMGVSVEPEGLVCCAWRQSDFDDAIIMRLYNPSDEPVEGSLRTAIPVSRAEETNYREQHTADLAPSDGYIAVTFTPYEIKTIRLFPAG